MSSFSVTPTLPSSPVRSARWRRPAPGRAGIVSLPRTMNAEPVTTLIRPAGGLFLGHHGRRRRTEQRERRPTDRRRLVMKPPDSSTQRAPLQYLRRSYRHRNGTPPVTKNRRNHVARICSRLPLGFERSKLPLMVVPGGAHRPHPLRAAGASPIKRRGGVSLSDFRSAAGLAKPRPLAAPHVGRHRRLLREDPLRPLARLGGPAGSRRGSDA